MPTVKITVSEKVTYCREVEMSEAEYLNWECRLDSTAGRAYDKVVEELAEKYIRRDDRDFFDADDLELTDLSVVVSA